MHLFAGTYFCFFLAILKIKDTISEGKLIFASNKTVCNNYVIENQWHQKKKKKKETVELKVRSSNLMFVPWKF